MCKWQNTTVLLENLDRMDRKLVWFIKEVALMETNTEREERTDEYRLF